MSAGFKPVMSVLPEKQKDLWPDLRGVSAELGFTLYGGTALALRYGHRESVDFDFFSDQPLDQQAIRRTLPFMDEATTLQESPDTWVVMTPPPGRVKISFFGQIDFGRVGDPEWTDDHVLLVASEVDLMATKLKVILQRAESKDYRDIAELIRAGHGLADGLSCAKTLFGQGFQPAECLRALVYFNDGDLDELPERDKITLVESVQSVQTLPDSRLKSHKLGCEIDPPGDMNPSQGSTTPTTTPSN